MHSRHMLLLCLALWLGLTFPSTTRADDPPTWVVNSSGSFVTGLCRDTRGSLWIATEAEGLWRLDESMPQGHQISHYLTSDGLGDNTAYALVCDKAGRIWAGTMNQGVSVFNGSQWQTYNQVTGPLGCHVIALAFSPVDGSVWGATEAGLFRYANSHWTYFTRAEGLPSDQATCLAFSKDGTLYVGTACDGIAIGSPRDNYRTWRHVCGFVKPLDQGRGDGLPSALVNCLLVGANGTIYCGTDTGLGWSADKGVHWVYKRGGDWLDRGAGAYKSGLVGDAMLCGLELAPLHPESEKPGIAIAAGKAVGGFLASRGFESGMLATDYGALDPKNGPTLAPKELYRSVRWGTFTWTGTGLTPNAPYRVRLHFAEFWMTQPGQRVFDVTANGSPALTHLDVFRAAGGKNRALACDFTAKADGLGRLTLAFQGSSLSSQGLHPAANLLEDYVTSLAEGPGGKLWIGHRCAGMEAIDENSGARIWPGPADDQLTDQVTAILPSSEGIWLGTAGSGLRLQLLPPVVVKGKKTLSPLLPPLPAAVALAPPLPQTVFPPLPTPAAPPTLAQLQAMLKQVQSLNSAPKPIAKPAHKLATKIAKTPAPSLPRAVYLGEDWATEGDWVGRYGRQYAVLCAAACPMDQTLTWDGRYSIVGAIGPHRSPDDDLRHWTHSDPTDDRRTLYSPVNGYRRQTEWDDHGEAYWTTTGRYAFDGPNIWLDVTIPQGDLHRVSLYFMNREGGPGGWAGSDRDRDYLVEVHPYTKTIAEAETSPVLAYGRVHDFWGGVYERFLLRGPGHFYIKIAKNGSLNTICQGVFIDKITGPHAMTDGDPLCGMNDVAYDPPKENAPPPLYFPVDPHVHPSAEKTEALALWHSLDASGLPKTMLLQSTYRILAYRAAMSHGGSPELGKNWRWGLQLWRQEDRDWFDKMMNFASQRSNQTVFGSIQR